MNMYKKLLVGAVLVAMPLLASASLSTSSSTALGQLLPATPVNGVNTLAAKTAQGTQLARSRGGFRTLRQFHRRFRSGTTGNINRNRNSRLRSFRRGRNIRGGSRLRSAPVQNIHRRGRRFGFRSVNQNPRGRR